MKRARWSVLYYYDDEDTIQDFQYDDDDDDASLDDFGRGWEDSVCDCETRQPSHFICLNQRGHLNFPFLLYYFF